MHSSNSLKTLAAALAVAALAACGGGGSDSPATPTTPTTPTTKFTKTDVKWTFELPASGSLCYDIDTQAQTADCAGSAWDVKVVSSGRTAALFTNSGPSSADGTGKGAALGTPFTYTWSKLKTYQDATVDPDSKQAVPIQAWIADSASSVFTGSNAIQTAAFEYDLNGTHQLSPNFRVFLITTNSASAAITGAAGKVYALQFTGYYGGATGTVSGWPAFRWVDTASPGNVQSDSVDATAGWVYYDLTSKAKTTESGNWQIAFNRYAVKLNGGVSGKGTVAGFLSKTPAGFYGSDGKTPVTAKFNATSNVNDTLADLTGAQTGPASVNAWVKDSSGSQLSPTYTGTYPNALNYGWFNYYPTDAAAAPAGLSQHQLKANLDAATLIRSSAGNSYARMHLTEIKYATATPAYSGKQTWTLEFDIQPAN